MKVVRVMNCSLILMEKTNYKSTRYPVCKVSWLNSHYNRVSFTNI